MYSPEDFGAMATIIAVAAIVTVLSTGKFELAIIVAEKHEKFPLLTLCLIILSISSVILYLAIYLFNGAFAEIFKGNEDWEIYLSASVLTMSFFNITFNYLTAKGKFGKIAVTSIVFAVINNAGALLLAFLTKSGLIISFIAARFISSANMVSQFEFKRLVRGVKKAHKNTSRYRHLMMKYHKFPRYAMPADAIDAYTKQLPVIMLNTFSSIGIVGLYALTDRVLNKPLSIIGAAVSAPFKAEATKQYKENGTCKAILFKVLVLLFCVSAVPFLLLYYYAIDVFQLLFGEEWRKAGEFVQLLIPVYFLQFLTSPITFVFYISGRQEIDFYLHILMAILLSTCFLIGLVWFDSAEVALSLYAISYSFIYITYLMLSVKFSVKREKQ